jgi:hypothetical protein
VPQYSTYLADVRTGHHIVATVFEACYAMYRASGLEEMQPVGETEGQHEKVA